MALYYDLPVYEGSPHGGATQACVDDPGRRVGRASGLLDLLPLLLPCPPITGNKSAFRAFAARRRPPHFRLETATEGNN